MSSRQWVPVSVALAISIRGIAREFSGPVEALKYYRNWYGYRGAFLRWSHQGVALDYHEEG